MESPKKEMEMVKAAPVKEGYGKGSAFEDGSNDRAGAKNDTLDFSDGEVARVTRAWYGDDKSDALKDGSNNGARVEDDILDFGERAISGVTEVRDEDIKCSAFEDGGDDRAEATTGLGVIDGEAADD